MNLYIGGDEDGGKSEEEDEGLGEKKRERTDNYTL